MENPCILIIDDDPGLRMTLADTLRAKGHDVLTAGNGAEGLALLEQNPVNLALIDLGLPDMSGLDVLDRAKAGHPFFEAIILAGNGTLDSSIEATNRGAFSYLIEPYEIDPLLLQVRRAIEKQQAQEKIARDSHELQKRNTELKTLFEVSQVISRTIDLKELLSEVLRTLTKTDIFPFEIKGAVFLVEEEKIRLASFVNISESELDPCRRIRPGECLCGHALVTGELLISRNSHEDLRHRLCNPSFAPHGHIIVPLKAAQRVVGLLNLYIETDSEVDGETLQLLSWLGDQIGIAINNARLFEETRTYSLHDPLTGLANRRFLEIQLEKKLALAKRYGEEFSIIMLDIDHFKKFNDTHGHLEGDRLLTQVADILQREVRRADYVFRYGGEEFLIILPETDPMRAQEAAERLRKAVEAQTRVTMSLGVAMFLSEMSGKEELIHRADAALYRAKEQGRNRVEGESGGGAMGRRVLPI